jgi:hypothetical protein
MKRISRREFSRLAIAGAAAAPLAGATLQEPEAQTVLAKPAATKPALTADEEKRVEEAVAEREKGMAEMRAHTLPYGLEPAFLFRVRTPARRAAAKE